MRAPSPSHWVPPEAGTWLLSPPQSSITHGFMTIHASSLPFSVTWTKSHSSFLSATPSNKPARRQNTPRVTGAAQDTLGTSHTLACPPVHTPPPTRSPGRSQDDGPRASALGALHLGSNPDSTHIYQLGDVRQDILLLWASISSCVKWGKYYFLSVRSGLKIKST